MLFEGNQRIIRGIKLVEFIRWANESFKWQGGTPPNNGVLALPPIQRSAAWGPKQVVDLWDSILRGLPLGSFMLQSRTRGGLAHRIGTDARNETIAAKGWDLLDGQQRLRSMLLGIYGPNLDPNMIDKRCLWIDLDADPGVYLFKLHLTSVSQPFGYDQNGYKLSLAQRRAARERFEPEGHEIWSAGRRAYNHELFGGFIVRKPSLVVRAEQTPMPPSTYPGYPNACWPPVPAGVELDRVTAPTARGRTIIPLHVLLHAWIENPHDAAIAVHLPAGHVGMPALREALTRFSEAEIPLINASSVKGQSLPLLYDRIGAGGTPLSNEERLFALYKYHQPAFHNIVRDICEKCGRVMVPSKIAAGAIRVANALAHQRRDEADLNKARADVGNSIPDINQFAKVVGQDAADQTGVNLRACLDELFAIRGGGVVCVGPFPSAFIRLFEALSYDKERNPLGLPKALLWRLPPNLIHVLLFWLLQQQKDTPPLDNNELIRFVMFWLLCSRSDDKISVLCFTGIREYRIRGEGNQIPLRAMFHAIKKDESLALDLVPPSEVDRILVDDQPREWLSLADRIARVEPSAAGMVERWWWDQNNFLPWLQRQYLDAAFPDFDPTADREDDTPYEVDHMVPSSDWGFVWWFREEKLKEIQNRDSLRWVRFEVGNSIGNKWLADGSTNSSWGNISFTEKLGGLYEVRAKNPTDPTALLLDVFQTGAAGLWQHSSPQGPVEQTPWTRDRREAFQLAVEKRAAWLYQCFYKTLGFHEWA